MCCAKRGPNRPSAENTTKIMRKERMFARAVKPRSSTPTPNSIRGRDGPVFSSQWMKRISQSMKTNPGSWSAPKCCALSVTDIWAMYSPMDQSPLDCDTASIPLLCDLNLKTPSNDIKHPERNNFLSGPFFGVGIQIQGCIDLSVRLKKQIIMNYCFHAVGIFPLLSLQLPLPSPVADNTPPKHDEVHT